MADNQTAARGFQDKQAAAAAEIGRLTGILRARFAEVGEHQALADVCALMSGADQAELAGLLTAALRMLAARPQPPR